MRRELQRNNEEKRLKVIKEYQEKKTAYETSQAQKS